MRLQNFGTNNKLKILKNGDSVELSEKYEFTCNYQGINIKTVITGNAEDIRKNFSNYKFILNQSTKKTFFQMDMNSKIAQKVLDEFATPVEKEENGDEETDSEDDYSEHDN